MGVACAKGDSEARKEAVGGAPVEDSRGEPLALAAHEADGDVPEEALNRADGEAMAEKRGDCEFAAEGVPSPTLDEDPGETVGSRVAPLKEGGLLGVLLLLEQSLPEEATDRDGSSV